MVSCFCTRIPGRHRSRSVRVRSLDRENNRPSIFRHMHDHELPSDTVTQLLLFYISTVDNNGETKIVKHLVKCAADKELQGEMGQKFHDPTSPRTLALSH